MAVLLITHDMGVIASRTDRVMVMYAGKIVEGAGTADLFDTMRHPYSEALFESIPRLNQDRQRAPLLHPRPAARPRDETSSAAASGLGAATAPRCAQQHEPLLSSGSGPSPSADVAAAAAGPGGHGGDLAVEPGRALLRLLPPGYRNELGTAGLPTPGRPDGRRR